MVHVRIVVPGERSAQVLELLEGTPSATNLIFFAEAARKPPGDVILVDVARADVSLIVADLQESNIASEGSIAINEIDAEISAFSDTARAAASGSRGNSVLWEDVESKASDDVELSFMYLAFMTLACLIASVGLLLDSPILIVGAMIVGPDFGPIAGLSVGIAERHGDLAKRSLLALLIGFPVAIAITFGFVELVRLLDLTPDGYATGFHPFTRFIAHPDWFSLIVAVFAGVAGVLSLTSLKSGALVGVLVSVTTIPAAAYLAVAAAFRDGGEAMGALAQLGANLGGIFVAGAITLWIQRLLYERRRARHLAVR